MARKGAQAMRIGSYVQSLVYRYWNDKETLVVLCASELGKQLWEHDSMYGTGRNREDHEAKVAKLGLMLGIAKTPEEFLDAIAKIETLED